MSSIAVIWRNGTSASPAVNYLVRLHADIGGKLKDNRKQFERRSEDMKHVEGGVHAETQ
jgi:hypothetical protein